MNTGRKINGAKDNGAIYGMAQTLRTDISGLRVVTDSLDHAIAVADVAYSASEAVSDLLLDMKEKALAASDRSLDDRSRAILNEEFETMRDQIGLIVDNAKFSEINLLDGSTPSMSPITDVHGGQSIDVPGYDIKPGGADTDITPTIVIDPFAAAEDALTRIESTLDSQNAMMNVMGGRLNRMQTSRDLAVQTSDILTKNLGTLVDADLGKESARLQAAQTKQQLRVQSQSIANQLPTYALRLFGQ